MAIQDWLSLTIALSPSINSIVKVMCLAFRIWLTNRYPERF
ncbi:UNVERIFIED_ORG: hypothetical protein M2382_003643 [Enterobacter sp. BIGb0239]